MLLWSRPAERREVKQTWKPQTVTIHRLMNGFPSTGLTMGPDADYCRPRWRSSSRGFWLKTKSLCASWQKKKDPGGKHSANKKNVDNNVPFSCSLAELTINYPEGRFLLWKNTKQGKKLTVNTKYSATASNSGCKVWARCRACCWSIYQVAAGGCQMKHLIIWFHFWRLQGWRYTQRIWRSQQRSY